MHPFVRRLPARLARRAAATCAAALLALGPLAVTHPASAATLVATCDASSKDAFSQPLDPNGTDNPQPETYQGKGMIRCLDVGGNLLAEGTVTFSGSIAAAECTGAETQGSLTFEIDWTDGTKTTGTLNKFNETDADGTGLATVSGTTDGSSTKFASYTVESNGTSSGTGCGTATGETNKSQTTVITFSQP